jgi:hypothetical protein
LDSTRIRATELATVPKPKRAMRNGCWMRDSLAGKSLCAEKFDSGTVTSSCGGDENLSNSMIPDCILPRLCDEADSADQAVPLICIRRAVAKPGK